MLYWTVNRHKLRRKGVALDIKPAKTHAVHAPAKRELASHTAPLSQSRPQPRSRRKVFSKKALIRYGILTTNLLIVVAAVLMVMKYSDSNVATGRSTAEQVSVSPLDEISAADIAVNVARMANLPEVTAVTNYADTINAEIETFTINRKFANIPQIMTADLKTLADIKPYVTQPGDTVSALAARFSVTSDSIKWSNDLLNDTLEPGITILIPPMNGIIYTVRSGDTPEKISQTYRLPASQVVLFNDVELTGLVPGNRIFLPNAQKPAPVFNFFVRYGYNGYDPGWCTYYAAAKGGAPGGWGHARTWAVNAARTPGWMVSKVPVPGAIAQTTGVSGDRIGGSWGHVGIVEAVKQENGQYYIKYSDMNGIAGFNRVGHSDWVPALDKFQNFVYRIQ